MTHFHRDWSCRAEKQSGVLQILRMPAEKMRMDFLNEARAATEPKPH